MANEYQLFKLNKGRAPADNVSALTPTEISADSGDAISTIAADMAVVLTNASSLSKVQVIDGLNKIAGFVATHVWPPPAI